MRQRVLQLKVWACKRLFAHELGRKWRQIEREVVFALLGFGVAGARAGVVHDVCRRFRPGGRFLRLGFSLCFFSIKYLVLDTLLVLLVSAGSDAQLLDVFGRDLDLVAEQQLHGVMQPLLVSVG